MDIDHFIHSLILDRAFSQKKHAIPALFDKKAEKTT